MKICVKINQCPRISSLFDHEWADDDQLRDAILKTCRNCAEYAEELPPLPEVYMEAWRRLYLYFVERLDEEHLDLMDRILESAKADLTASTA
jgi:hypothetical protein